MEKKPIFVITHSRSCSTAFERVFMTLRDILSIHHEPFGDAFYFGPEKISHAWQRWPPNKIVKSGKSHYTYDLVLQNVLDSGMDPTKRVFLKDMSYHIIPPSHSPNARPPSLQQHFAPNEAPNPTLLPTSILRSFRFVFLIRKPSSAIPSLHRCFIPPLSSLTDEHTLDPTELGYRELRILFDYLYPPASRSSKVVASDDEPLLIDADDLLADPAAVIHSLCTRLSLPYFPSMLSWPSQDDHDYALSLFQKYAGYHQDALNSTGLRPKPVSQIGQRPQSIEEENKDWELKYGNEAANMIREVVDMCQDDYEYLRQFRMQL
ncbi:MAG: hypothetical protein Q9225_007947 [Loekoesia sp. 1 TL-2023]